MSDKHINKKEQLIDPSLEKSSEELKKEKDSSKEKVYGVKEPEKKEKKKDGVRKPIKWIFISIIAAAIVLGCAIVLPLALSGADKDAVIKVPKNASIVDVRDSIAKYLGKDYADKTVKSLKMFGFMDRNRHGAYLISKGTSPFIAGRRMSRGAQHGVKFVVNGQRTKEDLAKLIANTFDITEEDMLEAFNDSVELNKHGTDPNKVIGYFLNNTYELYWNTTPDELLRRMRKEYRRFWNNERVEKAEKLRLTPREIGIIASITDEETNAQEEKGRIGRLYVNRLNIDMPLQSCPTVKYALKNFALRRLSNEDTRVQSPYNTYIHKGLPPGPIRTPDPRTIDLILNSEPSKDLYMCADTDSANIGRHRFASDYATHQRNAEIVHKSLNQRGIYH